MKVQKLDHRLQEGTLQTLEPVASDTELEEMETKLSDCKERISDLEVCYIVAFEKSTLF